PALLEHARSDPTGTSLHLVELGMAAQRSALARAYATGRAPTAAGMLFRDLSACDAFDMMAELGHIVQPTLIVVGEEDRLTPPKYAAFLRDHLERAQLTVVPGAGHYVMLEAPDAVADALRTWLAQA
ncbi:MAG: alpha/beta hydrolase, partial [Ktedonobacterales bacterium]|nr:alpha/beta hydrolase [Ktedonobacterales bacterium]